VLNASRHAKTQAWVLVATVITVNTLFLYLMLIGSNAKMFYFTKSLLAYTIVSAFFKD